MKRLNAAVGLMIAASASLDATAVNAKEDCPAIANASRAGLYVISSERKTAVEGSPETAQRLHITDLRHSFFKVALSAINLPSLCGKIGWRIVPAGSTPVNAADFGGKFPSGVVTLSTTDPLEPPEGEIEIWVPDDHVAEGPEQFRVLLFNPSTGRPLAGIVGRNDDENGGPLRRGPAKSFLMRNRLIMTVLDAPEQQHAPK